MTPAITFGEFTTCSCESSMLQFIQSILPRNLHLAFTLHDTILERAQKKLNGYLSEFLLHLYFFGELELFLVFRNIYLFRITKISILNKYVGFQKYIPVSDNKDINFEEIHWFSEIYTCFGLQNYQF